MQDFSHHSVLGAGEHMRRAHLQFLQGPAVQRLEVFDPGVSLPRLQEELNVHAVLHDTDAAALANRAGAVWIGSPDSFHISQLEAALKAKKHVFVEKPLATAPEELDRLQRILQFAHSEGLIVLTCHPRRFDPPFLWFKEKLPELCDDYGKPLAVQFDFTYHAPAAPWKMERSLLLDHANHEIDLIQFLFGTSKTVAIRRYDSANRYDVNGWREDGMSINLSGTRMLQGKIYDELLRVRFETGEVTLYATRGLCCFYGHEQKRLIKKTVPATDYDERNRAVTENFLRAIAGAAVPYLTADEMFFNTAFAVQLAHSGNWRRSGAGDFGTSLRGGSSREEKPI